MNLPRGGAAFAVTVLVRVGQKLWEHCRWLVLAAAICYVVEGHVLGRKRSTAREWLRSNRWAVFQFVALGGLPLSLLFAAKEGGDANSYSLHVYFSLIGVLLFLGHLMLKHESISRPVAAVCILLAAMVVPAAVTALDIPTLIRNLKTSDTEQVYQYDKKHPGEIYFSFFTLPVLMAEGHLYHFEYGLFHRELGQARVSQAHFLQYVPLNARDVQREPDNSPIREYLPQFSCETQQLGFPDLHFYATCLVPAPPK